MIEAIVFQPVTPRIEIMPSEWEMRRGNEHQTSQLIFLGIEHLQHEAGGDEKCWKPALLGDTTEN